MSITGFNRRRRELEEEKLKSIENQEEEINLENLSVKELKEKCEELGLEDYKSLKKEELIKLLKGDD